MFEELPPGVDPTDRQNPLPRPAYGAWAIVGLLVCTVGLVICFLVGGFSWLLPSQQTPTAATSNLVVSPAASVSPTVPAMGTSGIPVRLAGATPTVTISTSAPTVSGTPSTSTPIYITQVVYVPSVRDRFITQLVPITVQVTRETTRVYITQVPYPVITIIVVTATPTSTPTPTSTWTPTSTPTPTSTWTPTSTPTPTSMWTTTPTMTLTPEEP